MIQAVKDNLNNCIKPFWKNMIDKEHGGFYGLLDYELNLDKEAPKGVVLNSRILWFFSNAYIAFKEEDDLVYARQAYEYLINHCLDRENGGVYWSTNYNGEVLDSLKHTYNQAFAIYALASYYDASKNEEALDTAFDLYNVIETKCRDDIGYLEAFDREFNIVDNDKLSENGVMADKTMNTLLHVCEAYTELYRVSGNKEVKDRLIWIINEFADKVYNPALHRQEVFFDTNMNSLIDLHSYGHDIEAAWLIDRGCEVIGDEALTKKMSLITKDLTAKIYETAYIDHSLLFERDREVINTNRIWWVQAEGVVGFINGYEKDNTKTEYLEAAKDIWNYIENYVVDKRAGSEWFSEVDKDRKPIETKEIVEPWKCPYHNGRMCFEVIRRNIDA